MLSYLILLLLVLPVPAYSATPSDVPRPKPYEVNSIRDIELNYDKLTQDPDTVFYLKDTKTFLARPESAENSPEDLDTLARRSWFGRKPVQDWVEYDIALEREVTYPGVIPVSACQSQQYGGSGSVTFSYSLKDSLVIEPVIQNVHKLGIGRYGIAYDYKAQHGWGLTASTSGSVTCSVGPGQKAQVFMTPTFVKIVPKLRMVKYKLKKFVTDPDFTTTTSMNMLVENAKNRIDCATSDVVELFCKSEKIGTPDWKNPSQLRFVD
ncbi:uncharacterized protein CANTADRAFT_102679 [Suhomyces tanzawaensis NRRL Y-17324]|uniref:Uncharacterized protein n=1 Tax=Suhomyces tanzawaensis NRRL Y-17324 TaxID=984487 RepID=A0A1E4SC67_9ASCO|nr:uncharacterized protein CANTADRAFT_102679 [Suhomyces tanzawaensis NRRL Y-17324]ODV77107.1 hypothetical protein CANTADRAFT_102679 [Suhomyces tanzawaensis NRRL Y-17324]